MSPLVDTWIALPDLSTTVSALRGMSLLPSPGIGQILYAWVYAQPLLCLLAFPRAGLTPLICRMPRLRIPFSPRAAIPHRSQWCSYPSTCTSPAHWKEPTLAHNISSICSSATSALITSRELIPQTWHSSRHCIRLWDLCTPSTSSPLSSSYLLAVLLPSASTERGAFVFLLSPPLQSLHCCSPGEHGFLMLRLDLSTPQKMSPHTPYLQDPSASLLISRCPTSSGQPPKFLVSSQPKFFFFFLTFSSCLLCLGFYLTYHSFISPYLSHHYID